MRGAAAAAAPKMAGGEQQAAAPAALSFHNVSVVEKGRNRGGGSGSSSDSSTGGSSTDDDGGSALREVAGVAHAGELVAFVEPGGGGGSTLLRALCGGGGPATMLRSRPTSGVLLANGEEMPMGSLERAGLASLVARERPGDVRDCLSVHETLVFAAKLQLPKSSQRSRAARIAEVLRDLRMEHLAKDAVGSLSAGERRRLAIGCDALLSPPTLFFVDELTEGLYLHDAVLLCECLRTITRSARKYTVVVSMRQPTAEILQLMDRVTLLACEKMAFSGKWSDVPDFLRLAFPSAVSSPRAASPRAARVETAMASQATAERVLDMLTHPGEAPELVSAFAGSHYINELHEALEGELQRAIGKRLNQLEGEDADDAAAAARAAAAGSSRRDWKVTKKQSARSLGGQLVVVLEREATVLRREGAVSNVVKVATLSSVMIGLLLYQLEVTAGSARSRLNVLSLLIDLPSIMELGWCTNYIRARPRNELDISSGALAPSVHAAVWFILTVLRAVATTIPVMVITWPMIGLGESLENWLAMFGMVIMAKIIIFQLVLVASIRADTDEVAYGRFAVFTIVWYQARGWFVRKEANTAFSRGLMTINPARSIWQRMSVLLFAGKELPCDRAGNATTSDSMQQVCPMPGNALLQQNSLEDEPWNDVIVCGVWIIVAFFLLYRGTHAKNAGGNVFEGPLVRWLTSCCRKADQGPDIQPPGRDLEPSSPSSPSSRKPHKLPSSSRAISVDVIDEVESFLNAPVHLEFIEVRLATSSSGAIVQNASGQVGPGKMMLLLGPSGSGKSSLLKVLAGVADGHVSGEIRVNGGEFDSHGHGCGNIQHSSIDQLVESRTASYVPQDGACSEVLTVEETFQHAANMQLGHATRRVRSSRVFDVLRGLRLYKKRDKRISELDAGERHRVSIGTNGLLTPSRLLLLDEPTRGLLPHDELALMRMLKDLCESFQFTVIFSAHQPQKDVMEMTDQVLLLSNGATLYSGPTAEAPQIFSAAGFPFRGQNDAAEMMDVASDKQSAVAMSEFFSTHQQGLSSSDLPSYIAAADSTTMPKNFKRRCCRELWYLARRDIRMQLREPMCAGLFLFNIVAMAGVKALLTWRFESNAENVDSIAGGIWNSQYGWHLTAGGSALFYYPNKWYRMQKQDIIYYRYSIGAACVADFVVTSTRLFAAGCILGVLQYFAMGLDAGRTVSACIGVVLPMAAVGLFFDALVFCIVCCTSNKEALVVTIMTQLMGATEAFGGYFVKISLLPAATRWLAAYNPVVAAYSLSLYAYFSGIAIGCGDIDPAEQTVPCPMEGDKVLEILDVETDRETRIRYGALLIAWPLALRLVGAIVLKLDIRTRRKKAVQEKYGEHAVGMTCGYRAAIRILTKPFLWVFYRDLTAIGMERLPAGPVVVAHNLSNVAMDQLLLLDTFVSANRPISPLVPARWVFGEFANVFIKALVGAVRVIPIKGGDADAKEDSAGIIHEISVSSGEWAITGALFNRDLEDGCRLQGAWGEVLQVKTVLSDDRALIQTPNNPEQLIPTFTVYKKRVIMLDDGSLIDANSKRGPWKYKVEHQLDARESHRSVISQLHSGATVAFPPESASGDLPMLGRFQTELGIVSIITAATATEPEQVPSVVPVIVRWFNPHRMRSRAIIEIGEPIAIDASTVSQFNIDPQPAAYSFTGRVRREMVRMQGLVRDTAELDSHRRIRRLVQPRGQLSATEYCEWMRFVLRRDRELRDKGITDTTAQQLYLKLLDDATEYDTKRRALGVPDADIREGLSARPTTVLCGVIVCQSLLAFVLLMPALPGAVLAALPLLITNQLWKPMKDRIIRDGGFQEKSSDQGLDLVAFARLSKGLPISIVFTILYTVAAALVARSEVSPVDINPWFAALVPVVGPILVMIMIVCSDHAMDAAQAAAAAKAALSNRTALDKLTEQRLAMVQRAATILGSPSDAVSEGEPPLLAGKTVGQADVDAAEPEPELEPEPEPEPELDDATAEPEPDVDLEPELDERTQQLRALTELGIEQWSAAQVLEWVALLDLPPESVSVVRTVIEALGLDDGEELLLLVPKILQKKLVKHGAQNAEALAKQVIEQRDALLPGP
jgi:ABC-type multidrug transport system ATPase subunit